MQSSSSSFQCTSFEFDEVRLAWRAAVPFPDPQTEFIRGWLRSTSLDEIKDIMTRLRRLYTEGKLSPDRAEDHAGRFVSSCARSAREQRQAEQPICGEVAAHPQVPAPRVELDARPQVPEPPARWRQSWADTSQTEAAE